MMKYSHELTNGIIWYLKGILKKKRKIKNCIQKSYSEHQEKGGLFFCQRNTTA